jgi:hypothetical protein
VLTSGVDRCIFKGIENPTTQGDNMKLLTVGNPKIEKGFAKGFLTAVLHLAPARLSGYQVCPLATDGCTNACLNIAGRGGIFAGESIKDMSGEEVLEKIREGALKNRIQSARIAKTRRFFEDREAFMADIVSDIKAVIRKADRENLQPAIRLNGTSDIRWETVAVDGHKNVMAMFPDLIFYDYSKIFNRRVSDIPNYFLTFSLAEDNEDNARKAFQNGMNVAVVFRNKLPDTFMGAPVINGDETDLRFLDPAGSIVGLKAKGKAKTDDSGFVRDLIQLTVRK